MEYLQYLIKLGRNLNNILLIVLNLIINGIPSIPYQKNSKIKYQIVLNLIINGIPSILEIEKRMNQVAESSFKPYYKWNTFNTVLILQEKQKV